VRPLVRDDPRCRSDGYIHRCAADGDEWPCDTLLVLAATPSRPAAPELRAALERALNLVNSLGIYGPNTIHAEQGMHPAGKDSVDRTWDGPGWCVCRLPWPCEAKALGDLLAALASSTEDTRLRDDNLTPEQKMAIADSGGDFVPGVDFDPPT
jgi:hypothetical protein